MIDKISELEVAGAFMETFKSVVLKIISEQSTADMQEVRHGEWNPDDDLTYNCSECGKWLIVEQRTADMNYCPNCGARMDRMDKEGEND